MPDSYLQGKIIMKVLIILLFVGISFFACDLWSLNHTQKSENETVVLSPTPETDNCRTQNYKHKSEAEIAAMTSAQRIEEMVNEQIFHMPALGDDYGSLINKYTKKDGIKILPILIKYMNDYNPNKFSDCDKYSMRFFVATVEASNLDNNFVRLRGTKEGQLAIESLERGIERMRKAGFDKDDHRKNGNYESALMYSEQLKGINIHDDDIISTLQARHNIQMNESELLKFSNFLTSLDPTYPSWSEVGEYGPPRLLENSEKYYEAYLKFKAKN